MIDRSMCEYYMLSVIGLQSDNFALVTELQTSVAQMENTLCLSPKRH